MNRFILPLLAASLPAIAVAHPLPHGGGGLLEAINHSVISQESVEENHPTPISTEDNMTDLYNVEQKAPWEVR